MHEGEQSRSMRVVTASGDLLGHPEQLKVVSTGSAGVQEHDLNIWTVVDDRPIYHGPRNEVGETTFFRYQDGMVLPAGNDLVKLINGGL